VLHNSIAIVEEKTKKKEERGLLEYPFDCVFLNVFC